MPTYDYLCPANRQIVEVLHGMGTTLHTWGQVCTAEDLDPGTTPADTAVEKLLGAGMVLTNSRANLNEIAGPNPQGGCCGGGCGAR